MLIINTLIGVLLFGFVYETIAYNWTTNTDNGLEHDSQESFIDLDDTEGDMQENALRRYKRSSKVLQNWKEDENS